MFRNRGEMPNINPGNNPSNGGGYRAPHYRNYWNGNFIIIQYDKTFVAIELISILLIVIIAVAVYLFAYNVPYKDPIATIKSNFLTAQLISIGITILATVLVTFFTKSSKENLIRNLRIVAIVSLAVFAIFFAIKLNYNSKYTENTFGEFYEQYERANSKNSNKISIGLSGVKILNEKDYYIDESIKAYTNFSVKTILYMVIHVIVILLIFYLSFRLSSMERKKENLTKDDAVLFDDEENVKY